MNRHSWMMLLGCLLPLLLIFILPLLGIRGNYSVLAFIVAMFACHVLMPMHHGKHDAAADGKKENNHSSETTNHESHQR